MTPAHSQPDRRHCGFSHDLQECGGRGATRRDATDANQTSKVTAKLQKRNAIFFMRMMRLRGARRIWWRRDYDDDDENSNSNGFQGYNPIVLWANLIKLPNLGLMVFLSMNILLVGGRRGFLRKGGWISEIQKIRCMSQIELATLCAGSGELFMNGSQWIAESRKQK